MIIKKSFKFLFVLFLMSMSYGQEGYMDAIVNKACECVSDIPEEENITAENFGFCIITEAFRYEEELLRDYNIRMKNIDVDGEELGRIVGIKMLSSCPDQVKRLAAIDENENEEDSIFNLEGVILSITKSDFISLSVKENNGKVASFYWLTFVESVDNFQADFENFKNKRVRMRYSIVELFDHRIGEYRNFNVIESIDELDAKE